MRKKLFISALIGLVVIVLSGSAFAWSGKADIEGKSDEFKPGGAKGYYIWHDERGFHIWTTTRWQGHVFSGIIRTDGVFIHVRGNRLEDGDFYRVDNDQRDKSWFEARHTGSDHRFAMGGREVNYDNAAIRFKFDTAGGADGLNFNISDSNYVEFDLFIDGKPVPRREIYMGDESWHPSSNNFRIYP